MKPEPDYKAMWEDLKETAERYRHDTGNAYLIEGREFAYFESKHTPQPLVTKVECTVVTFYDDGTTARGDYQIRPSDGLHQFTPTPNVQMTLHITKE